MSEKLKLTLLGHIEIRRDGIAVTNITGKTLALLSYLAVTGRPHTRPALAGLLWGGMPEAKARGNLSKALSTLRGSFGEYLTITRQTVAFEREADYWLDVEAFEVKMQGAETGDGIDQLREAVELYRGDFLDGFYVRDALEFEEWVLAQRAQLRESALRGLHTLAAHFAEKGEAGRRTAIDHALSLIHI